MRGDGPSATGPHVGPGPTGPGVLIRPTTKLAKLLKLRLEDVPEDPGEGSLFANLLAGRLNPLDLTQEINGWLSLVLSEGVPRDQLS